jgi:hypothetical protein
MNRWIWTISASLSLAGCGLSNIPSQPPVEATSPQVQPQVNQQIIPPASSENTESPQSLSQNNEGESSIQQDYAPTTPLPETGKVTIRGHIRTLDPDRLIADCPVDSAPYAFAESTHYRVQICSEEYDPWLPKYYLGQAKDGSGEIRITNSNVAEARQLIFKSGGYTYVLYRDATRPEEVNAYLQVFTPDGDGYSEALLYFYEAGNYEATATAPL